MVESQKQYDQIELEYVLQKFVEAGFTIDRTAVVDENESLTAEEALDVLENIIREDSLNVSLQGVSRADKTIKFKYTKYGSKVRYELGYGIFNCYFFEDNSATRIVPYELRVFYNKAGFGGMELGDAVIHGSFDAPYVTYTVTVQGKEELIVLGVRAYRYQIHNLLIHFHATKMDYAKVSYDVTTFEPQK